uniref:Uncharacterized protein n=1 Tax=Rhizophora mucronata TaxID=61149 RepID=A0A2P2ISN6_RHIMU
MWTAKRRNRRVQ